MLDLASNVLSQTSRFLSDFASSLETMSRMHKSDRSAKSCSSSGRTATKTRPASSVSQLCTRNCRNLHVQWLQDRKSCRTMQRMIPMERLHLRQHMVDLALLQVSIRQAQHTVLSLSRRLLQAALRLSSPRAGTRTKATLPSVCRRRRIT